MNKISPEARKAALEIWAVSDRWVALARNTRIQEIVQQAINTATNEKEQAIAILEEVSKRFKAENEKLKLYFERIKERNEELEGIAADTVIAGTQPFHDEIKRLKAENGKLRAAGDELLSFVDPDEQYTYEAMDGAKQARDAWDALGKEPIDE